MVSNIPLIRCELRIFFFLDVICIDWVDIVNVFFCTVALELLSNGNITYSRCPRSYQNQSLGKLKGVMFGSILSSAKRGTHSYKVAVHGDIVYNCTRIRVCAA